MYACCLHGYDEEEYCVICSQDGLSTYPDT
jgi:hypothetical protein